jgi:hypothetical protein
MQADSVLRERAVDLVLRLTNSRVVLSVNCHLLTSLAMD